MKGVPQRYTTSNRHKGDVFTLRMARRVYHNLVPLKSPMLAANRNPIQMHNKYLLNVC